MFLLRGPVPLFCTDVLAVCILVRVPCVKVFGEMPGMSVSGLGGSGLFAAVRLELSQTHVVRL